MIDWSCQQQRCKHCGRILWPWQKMTAGEHLSCLLAHNRNLWTGYSEMVEKIYRVEDIYNRDYTGAEQKP